MWASRSHDPPDPKGVHRTDYDVCTNQGLRKVGFYAGRNCPPQPRMVTLPKTSRDDFLVRVRAHQPH